jgi:very-long-chain ceramide synthase
MGKTVTDMPEPQYLWVNSPYWLNNQAIWRTWPAREMSGPFKWYNLVQLAFWFQQILVIHLEKRRKDHNQMLTHHIITCITISVAYVYRYTNVSNVVLCLMDIVDLLLPVSPPHNPADAAMCSLSRAS